MNTDYMVEPGKSGGGPPQSKTWRKFGTGRRTRSVLGSARGSRAGSGGAHEPFVGPFSFVKRVFGAPPKTATGPVALPIPHSEFRMATCRVPQGEPDGNSFTEFSLGWTIGAIGV